VQRFCLSEYTTSLGNGAVAANAQGICRVWLPGDEWPVGCNNASDLSRKAALQLGQYFQGNVQQFDLPVDISILTVFQQCVLCLTMKIPYGMVTTYGQLALQAGSPRAARAVGAALAANPVPGIIPCHRVIAASGALAGFSGAGGLLMKKFLLGLEGTDLTAIKKSGF
jgi:methylated-DNA-[protein]-cysteine S-methyltransferase